MSELIFVTGGSGFLGAHIVDLLLAAGYSVRAAARSTKTTELQSAYASFGERFQVVDVPDIATSQFPQHFEGVYAVIHSAAPLPSRGDAAHLIKGAVEGTLNVVRQAEKAGITRVVVTSSIASVLNPEKSFTDKDWNPVGTREDVMKVTEPLYIYGGAKTLAERALWEFADAHPHIDITTLNPPFFYGPFSEASKVLLEPSALSSNGLLYNILKPDGTFPPSAPYVDVRDVAKAHVLALKGPLSSVSGIGRKRIIMGSIYDFDFKSALELLTTKRPELKDRITRKEIPDATGPKKIPFDVKRVEQVLGFKEEDYTPFETTFLGAIDALIEVERKSTA